MIRASVVIADDHPLICEGIRQLLKSVPDVDLMGEAHNGVEALSLVTTYRPNILILDIAMPTLDGLSVISQLRCRSPETRIIVVTMYAVESYVVAAFRAGASAYVHKGDPDTRAIINALRAVLAGHKYLSPPFSERAIIGRLAAESTTSADPIESLSPREREVLSYISQGFLYREIGNHLHITARTVETHAESIRHKLGLRRRDDLIRYADRRVRSFGSHRSFIGAGPPEVIDRSSKPA